METKIFFLEAGWSSHYLGFVYEPKAERFSLFLMLFIAFVSVSEQQSNLAQTSVTWATYRWGVTAH